MINMVCRWQHKSHRCENQQFPYSLVDVCWSLGTAGQTQRGGCRVGNISASCQEMPVTNLGPQIIHLQLCDQEPPYACSSADPTGSDVTVSVTRCFRAGQRVQLVSLSVGSIGPPVTVTHSSQWVTPCIPSRGSDV
jgi:hypothetical protein